MKAQLLMLIISLFSFYGDESIETKIVQKQISTIRPTLEQKIQLKQNELNRVDSEIKEKLAEFKSKN